MPVFRHLPVTSLIDVTHNFEQIESERATELQGLGGGVAVGAWANPESFSAKLETFSTLQVRTEQGGAVARLKGIAKAKEEVPVKTALFTLPVRFRPKEDVFPLAGEVTVGAVLALRIKATGVVENETPIPVGRFPTFDGITFNLT